MELDIESDEQPDIYKLPISALRQQDRVWIVDEDRRLVVTKVDVARIGKEHAFVRSGLSPGQEVVTSAISLPIEGMSLEPTQ